MTWVLDHLLLATVAAAAVAAVLPLVGFFGLIRPYPAHRAAALVVVATSTAAVTVILAVTLAHAWTAKADRERRLADARVQHLQRLQVLLRHESRELDALARSVREGRYFTLVADDERRAVWEDEALTADVERHFPDYFRERELLIRRILDHDGSYGRIRAAVSASLQLDATTEHFRGDLVPALVNKCGGAGRAVRVPDVAEAYDRYRCSPALASECRGLLDRAEDLADAASMASERARQYAEETVLHGTCKYVPAFPYDGGS